MVWKHSLHTSHNSSGRPLRENHSGMETISFSRFATAYTTSLRENHSGMET